MSKKNENIYTSRYIQGLEDVYCHSRSTVTSEMGLSCCSANFPTRIINGGKKAIYTATMTAMLLNNTIPAYVDLTVYAGQTSSGLTVGANPVNSVVSVLANYGSTINTFISYGGQEHIYDGGIANGTTISSYGQQHISNGAIASNTLIYYLGYQYVSLGGITSGTTIEEHGNQYIYSGGVANNTDIFLAGSQMRFLRFLRRCLPCKCNLRKLKYFPRFYGKTVFSGGLLLLVKNIGISRWYFINKTCN